MSYLLNWQVNNTVVSGSYYFQVSFPAETTPAYTLTLYSPALNNNTSEILTNVRLFLDGPDANLLQSWTSINTTKPTLNGGVEVSFDGIVWTRFDSTHGLNTDNSTWLELPASAIGVLAVDGQLAPYDFGTILLRIVIPPSFNDYRILSFNLGVDFDII